MTRVEYVEESLRRPAQDTALESVRADAVTLRTAMDWADGRGDQLSALRIASAVPIGLMGERRQIITDLLVRVGNAADGWVAAVAYTALGNVAYEQGDWLASSGASAIARKHFVLAGSDRDAAWADLNGAYASWGMGDLLEVDQLASKAIALFRTGADTMGLGYALSLASLRTSDLDDAQRLAAEADELLRATDSPMGIAHNVEGRGIIAYDRDELADAAVFVAEAVELFARFGNVGCCAHALESAAVIVGQAGQAETATELLGAADELRRSSGANHKPWEIRAAPRRHRRPHCAAFSRRARGRADRGKAPHPRIRRSHRARRALDRGAGVTTFRLQGLLPPSSRQPHRLAEPSRDSPIPLCHHDDVNDVEVMRGVSNPVHPAAALISAGGAIPAGPGAPILDDRLPTTSSTTSRRTGSPVPARRRHGRTGRVDNSKRNQQAKRPRRSRFRLASPSSQTKSSWRRAAGPSWRTRPSATSTKQPGAATSPPGKSRRSSPRRCGPCSPRCDSAHERRRRERSRFPRASA